MIGFIMAMIGLAIVLPQLAELIDVFHVTMMKDSSDLVADEQFHR
jgi:hypothetical protein